MKRLLFIIVIFLTFAACTQTETTDITTTQESTTTTALSTSGDMTPPVISGLTDLEYVIGDGAPDYRANIEAIDDSDGELTSNIIIDSSAVDLLTEGTYTVTISVSDSAGNETTETYEIHVSPYRPDEVLLDLALIDFTEGIDLPAFGPNGTIFSWISRNPLVISNQGYVISPPLGSEPVEVTLTAMISNGTYIGTKDFIVVVEPNPSVVINNSTELPFDNESIRYILDETQTLEIFYEENGNVPYVDIEKFLEFLDGSIDFSLFEFTYSENQLLIEYTQDDFTFEGYMANGSHSAVFDFSNNTLTVSSYDFFRGYINPSELGPYDSIVYQSHESTTVSETIIPLGDYNVDLVTYDDGTDTHYVIPFHIAKLLFLNSHRFNVYYNGVKLTGYDDAYVAWDENELDPDLYEMNFGPLNDQDLPQDLKIASYHFLALTFDYFHGLKDEDDIDTFYETIVYYAKDIIDGNESDFVEGMWRALIAADDPGTWYSRVGYYDDNPLSYLDPSYNDSHKRLKELFEEYYYAKEVIDEGLGTNIASINTSAEDTDEYLPDIRLIDNNTTAIIYLVEFFDNTTDDIKTMLDNLPLSVDNVIFDTSVSFFGKPHIAMEILGLMTNQPIVYSLKNTFDGQISTYNVTVNQPFYDYNYYIISSGFTYGVANIFIQLAKDNNLATILGGKSIGGTCPLTSITATDGTNLMMSSSSMFIRRIGNEVDGYTYESYEFGIEPDYILEKYATENDIIAIIDQAETDNQS